jgi:hypothetical protein
MARKIMIAVPSAGSIEPETFVSIYNMDVPQGFETELKIFYSYLIDDVRNRIADHAITNKFDAVLFVDSDMKLPRETLTRLISQDKDIVSGLYVKKNDGEKIIELFVKKEGKTIDNAGLRNATEADFHGRSLVEVEACGFGCILVRTHVLEKIGYPYFKVTVVNREKRIGEDIDFCLKAKGKWFKIHALTDLRVGHIGRKEFNL